MIAVHLSHRSIKADFLWLAFPGQFCFHHFKAVGGTDSDKRTGGHEKDDPGKKKKTTLRYLNILKLCRFLED